MRLRDCSLMNLTPAQIKTVLRHNRERGVRTTRGHCIALAADFAIDCDARLLSAEPEISRFFQPSTTAEVFDINGEPVETTTVTKYLLEGPPPYSSCYHDAAFLLALSNRERTAPLPYRCSESERGNHPMHPSRRGRAVFENGRSLAATE